MSQELLTQNIVLVTENLNTAIFTEYWFIKNGIIREDEIIQPSIFVPGFVKIETNDWRIEITAQFIQFVLKTDDISKSNTCIKQVLSKMVSHFLSLGIRAIGFNFTWLVSDAQDIAAKTIELFGNGGSPVYDQFMTGDSELGAIFKKQYNQSTLLNLTIKTAEVENEGKRKKILTSSFNYHRSIQGESATSQIEDQLKNWNQIRQNAQKISCLI